MRKSCDARARRHFQRSGFSSPGPGSIKQEYESGSQTNPPAKRHRQTTHVCRSYSISIFRGPRLLAFRSSWQIDRFERVGWHRLSSWTFSGMKVEGRSELGDFKSKKTLHFLCNLNFMSVGNILQVREVKNSVGIKICDRGSAAMTAIPFASVIPHPA